MRNSLRLEAGHCPPMISDEINRKWRLVDSDSDIGVDVALLTAAGDVLCLLPYGAVAARPPDADVFDEEDEKVAEL